MKHHRRSSSKLARAAALYLLAGAITTIAVAWGIVLAQSVNGPKRFPRQGVLDTWCLWAPPEREPAHDYISFVTRRDIGFYQLWMEDAIFPVRMPRTSIDPSTDGPVRRWCRRQMSPRFRERMHDSVCVTGGGWPFISLWHLSVIERYPFRANPVLDLEGGVELQKRSGKILYLPLRPAWSGLLLNVAFYGTIWLLFSVGFARIKSFVRSRRGRCTRCGYILKEVSTGCPECGFGRAN